MTDKEKLIRLLTGFGVEFYLDKDTIECHENGKNIKGYIGFFTCFEFDDSGAFVEMGAYE